MTASLTSGSAVQQAKHQLRKQISNRLKQIPPDQLALESRRVIDRLVSSASYRSAASISCYLSLPHSEVQTDSLIHDALAQGKHVYVPYCPVEDKTTMRMVRLRDTNHFDGLRPNRWGIREVDPNEVESLQDVDQPTTNDGPAPAGLDLLILPGLAFDPYRRRLGHGRGYYDRYINTYCLSYPARFNKPPPRLVALALTEQMVRPDQGEEIPTNEWDRLADEVITPDETYT
ncbi:nagb/rpia/CoA transferase-like protein [Rhodotorula sp. JG-1b]|nr:nagb/rpia/CoA transferase-like protein [Rhodotorula sp. JG-1b]